MIPYPAELLLQVSHTISIVVLVLLVNSLDAQLPGLWEQHFIASAS